MPHFFFCSGGVEGNLFYSFDYGPIHFIALSSEYVEFWHFLAQYQWLEKDLASVDRSHSSLSSLLTKSDLLSRSKTPWIFTSWHRPWYCSNNAHQGSGSWMMDSYEDLLYKHKVPPPQPLDLESHSLPLRLILISLGMCMPTNELIQSIKEKLSMMVLSL